jgi:hypothetical protein
MKTIKKNSEIVRVKDEEAYEKVKQGWGFVNKTEWKKLVRDKNGKTVEAHQKPKVGSKPKKEKKVKLENQSAQDLLSATN